MPKPDTIVFIVDDDVSVREALEGLFRSVGLRVESFASAEEFLARRRGDESGCVVLDVRLPNLNGLDLQKRMAKLNLDLPIIFITGHGDVSTSVQAMKGGALDFLTKPFADQDLLDVVGQAIRLHCTARQHRDELRDLRECYESLTPREREVMSWVVAGLLNKQIAGELGRSEITIKIHRGHVMHKMQAASLPDLVRMAARLGICNRSVQVDFRHPSFCKKRKRPARRLGPLNLGRSEHF